MQDVGSNWMKKGCYKGENFEDKFVPKVTRIQ